jgi:hypothetical protein
MKNFRCYFQPGILLKFLHYKSKIGKRKILAKLGNKLVK